MLVLEEGAVLSASNPKQLFYGIEDSMLRDVFELSFQIFDVSDAGKTLEPVQIFPGSGRQVVNLVADRLGLGRYTASWTVPTTTSRGRHEIHWFWKFDSGDVELEAVEDFEIVPTLGTLRGPRYAGLSDLRGEDVCGVTDQRLLGLLVLASRFVEKVTRRHFEPRFLTLKFDGTGSPALWLDQPIIALETVSIDDETTDLDDITVYARHLSGLLSPDDRQNPKLMLEGRWPKGRQNLTLDAVFGYTDPDIAPWGVTPDAIRVATMLLVLRDIPKLTDTEGRADSRQSYRIIEERTRDQSYRLGPGRADLVGKGAGEFTGDPEIDDILAQYMAPPTMRAV